MKSRVGIALIVCASPLFIYMSCKSTTSRQCEEVICTMDFRGVAVQVKDNTGNAVRLDEAYTTRVKTGERIDHEVNKEATGNYIVLDDSYQKKLQQSTAEFRFVGKRSGKEVVNELYTISADCCHIARQSGKGEVVVP